MQKIEKEKLNRRSLIRTALRSAAFGALGLFTGNRLAKTSQPLGHNSCVNAGLCRGCSAFDDCALPEALSAKQNTKGADNV